MKILFAVSEPIDPLLLSGIASQPDFPFDYSVATNFEDAGHLLDEGGYDAAVADYALPGGTAEGLISRVSSVPLVISAKPGEEDCAVRAVKLGAYDFIMRDMQGAYLKTLALTLQSVIKRKQYEQELELYREQLESIVSARTRELEHELSERTKSAIRAERTLKEKELMLKEIHHRVKNSMQIISGLISMEALNATDEKSQTLLRESEHRVRSIAMLHENILSGGAPGEIDFGVFAGQLAGQLVECYARRGLHVELKLESSGAMLGLEEAMPCTQILNELVTNSLKYAFVDRAEGRIFIRFRRDASGYRELQVADDGAGIDPPYVAGSARKLGLQLVEALVSQLKGYLTCTSAGGTVFTIRF